MNEATVTGPTVFDHFQGASTAVVAVADDAIIRYANDRALEVFGYCADEMLGEPIEMLVPRERAGAHVSQREGYLQEPIARPLDSGRDLKGRRKDGTEFAAEIALTPLETATGRLIVATVLDVSLRHEAEEQVRRQSRSYLALARMNEAVARAEDESSLFRAVCNVAVVHGGFVGAWIATRGSGSSLQIRASAGSLATRLAVASADSAASHDFLTEQVRLVRRAGGGDPGLVVALATGKPWFTEDFASRDDPMAALLSGFGVRAAAALPLRSRGRPVASLALYADEAGVFDDNLRELLIGAADNISLALDRFQAKADLDGALSQRTELLRRLVTAQERERNSIAADVHDEPVQSLAAVDLRLGLLQRQLLEAAPELVSDVEHIHHAVTTVSDQLRHLLFELEPVSASSNLTDLLEEAAAHVFELSPTRWEIENDPDPREQELSLTTRTQAIRIAKEAMVNAAKHARADTVRLRVAMDDDGVTVRVADDGVGIPPELRRSPPGHRGISGMLDRAEVAGGSLSVTSATSGTTVSVWLPRH
jgi:PAS domain S-box-containing protein